MKLWKRGANKKLRSKAKQLLHHIQDWDDLIIPHRDEVDNRWNSPMDGRIHIEWKKPDNDTCIREWSKYAGERWRRKYKEHPVYSGVAYPDGWERVELPELVDGHYPLQAKKYREECHCIRNKNSWYWQSFRK